MLKEKAKNIFEEHCVLLCERLLVGDFLPNINCERVDSLSLQLDCKSKLECAKLKISLSRTKALTVVASAMEKLPRFQCKYFLC